MQQVGPLRHPTATGKPDTMIDDLRVEVRLDPPPHGWSSSGSSSATTRRVVVEAAAAFLEGQRRLLRSGLDAATDDAVVADVVRRHEDAHEAWVSTVAALRDHVDEDVVQQVIDLYGFHGRVAGGLAGERTLRLSGTVETAVRRILGDQLDQMTDRILAHLAEDPDGGIVPGGSTPAGGSQQGAGRSGPPQQRGGRPV